jgi:transcriptional regulator with XRE-family HTH domain
MSFDEGLDQHTLAGAIGERLRAFREEHGLSQADVAERTGISREQINRYEAGKMVPTLKKFGILVRFMDVGTHWMLFGGSEDVKSLVRDRSLLKRFLAIQALDLQSQTWFKDLADAFLQNGSAARREQFEKLFDEL